MTFAYSPEKEKLLKPLITSFNREQQVDGVVFVEGINAASGDAEARIANGTFKPVAWSPASSLWGRLLNFEADRPYTADEAPSIVRTPLVIAMWEPMARALGYPRKQLGFADILTLATSGQGWAEFGRPEFGAFKLVHTNPDFSTSGLSAVVAEYYAATGKKEGLTEADVNNPKARKRVRDIERSIVHYGDTTLFIAEQLKKEGPGYASAVAMEEVTLLDFNRTRGDRDKLVAIYPAEGTFDSDSPFFTLNATGCPTSRPRARRRSRSTWPRRSRPRSRPSRASAPPIARRRRSPRSPSPTAPTRSSPSACSRSPEPRVLARIKEAWRRDRKPANILLVLDTSGSMNEQDRLERAKQGLESFFRGVEPQDAVGLTIFSDRVQPLVAPAPLSKNGAELRARVRDLIADGGTAFYDATVEAFDTVREQRETDRINAVVLLTDGEDTDSQLGVDEVVRHLEAQGDSANRVRVFTIAYSSGATGARENLKRIAAASGGLDYEGKTENIESVYRSISSFF